MSKRTHLIFGLVQCVGLVLLVFFYGWPSYATPSEMTLAPMFARAAEQQGIAPFIGPVVTPLLYEQHSQTLVQYTRTHRLELVDGKVQLAALGRELTHHRQQEPPFQWQDPGSLELSETAIFIAESGHSIDEPFRSYWEQHGQVAALGWPISEAFVDIAAIEGTPMLVQYFERARLVTAVPPAAPEEEPEEQKGHIESGIGSTGVGNGLNTSGGEQGLPPSVHASLLGEQHLQLLRNFNPQAFLELPTPGGSSGDVVPLASASWFYNPASNDGRNMARAMELLDSSIIDPGHRLSTLASIGPLTEENGYLPGSAIADGVIVDDSIAGGVCAVSTLIYRAAWIAGLPIHARSGHSLFLNNFHDGEWLGIEAAIDSRGPDLVIGNDTRGPLLVRADVDPARRVLTVTLYGLGDGRIVKRMDPEPSAALADMLRDRGLLSMNADDNEVFVTNERLIIFPDGRTRNDRVTSFYRMPQQVMNDE